MPLEGSLKSLTCSASAVLLLTWQSTEIELSEMVAGRLKLRDRQPMDRHVCYLTELQDVSHKRRMAWLDVLAALASAWD